MNRKLLYPVYREPLRMADRVALSLKATAGFCPVCGHLSVFGPWRDNLRETGSCGHCASTNRDRQVACVLRLRLGERLDRLVRSLADLVDSDLRLYSTECSGPLHRYLDRAVEGYISSEYFGPNYSPGQMVKGIRNEDLTGLSFADSTFDLVVSSDVLEHVPLPYKAHKEILRVLRPGGSHVFTVPFHQTRFLDEVLAVPATDGTPRLLDEEALYHHDPLREEGALVYTIFSLEMLVKLRRIGFRTHMYRMHNVFLGILGSNAIVFEAAKEEPAV